MALLYQINKNGMNKDNRRIKNEDELREFFFANLAGKVSPIQKRRGEAGVMVDTKLRREVLTGIDEGKIVINGRVLNYQFESLGGGVWKCTIPV